ncbi:MAG: hypothetical protein EXS37_04395 [Opitutus sp.]|nr:hypothetical protein [Opitutus sp.]
MRIIHPALVSLLLALVGLPLPGFAADSTSVHAILITASNHKAAADPKLAPYEAPLQRNLPESSFRYVGEGAANVSIGGHADIPLGRGHHLELECEKGDAGVIVVKVRWLNGEKVVMSTSLSLQPGVPAVLGRRPSDDGETPIVLVIAK